MKKIEQRNLQVFFIPKDSDLGDLERFVAKNHAMLKFYIMILEELNPRVVALLEQYEIDYIKPKNAHFSANLPTKKEYSIHANRDSSANHSANPQKDSPKSANLFDSRTNQPTNKNANLAANLPLNHSANPNANRDSASNPNAILKSQIFTEIIRSGREITSQSDIMIFNRVNSGAHIVSERNIAIFGKCEGEVRCNGDFMILSSIANGKILFNGMAVAPSMLKHKLNLLLKDRAGFIIIDILSLLK